MLCDADIPPDSHWAIRGICCICSYTVSSDFRNVDEKNRDEVNAFFNTNIESGTICMTCWSEFIRFKRDVLHPWNEESSSFPDLLGFSNHLFPSNLLYNTTQTSSNIQEQQPTNSNNVQAQSPTISQPTKRKTKNASNGTSRKRNQTTDKQKTKKQKQSNKTTKERSKKQDSADIHSEITKTNAIPSAVPPAPSSPPHMASELSFLNSLKVKDIEEQLKKMNASTKGSKAQLTQRLVRYMYLFANNQPVQPVLYDTTISSQHANVIPINTLPNHVSMDLSMVNPTMQKPVTVIYSAQMQPTALNRDSVMQVPPDHVSSMK